MEKGSDSAEDAIQSTDCFRCGYNLHGIADDQACPECGLLAARSRRTTDELHETRPKWLTSISWGVNLILLAFLLIAIWPSVHTHAISNRPNMNSLAGNTYDSWYFNSFFLGYAVAAVALLCGVLLLTRREGYKPADDAERPRRLALRIAATAPLLAVGSFYVSTIKFLMDSSSDMDSSSGFSTATWIGITLLTVGEIPLVILGFLHLRAIAKRARSAHLAEHCVIVGIGTSASFFYLFAFFVYGWRYQSDGPNQNSAFGTIAVLLYMVFPLLFGLWSLYLLIRFAISFRRAARQLRSKWKRDDRALEAK